MSAFRVGQWVVIPKRGNLKGTVRDIDPNRHIPILVLAETGTEQWWFEESVVPWDAGPWTAAHTTAQRWIAANMGRNYAMGPLVDSLAALLKDKT